MFKDEKTYKAYMEKMDTYIRELEKLNEVNPEEAKRQARESLIRSGILNTDGSPKKQICD